MPRKKIGGGYLYRGIKERFPLCCVLFFIHVWHGENRKFFKEYCSTMDILSDNKGLIMCPDCVAHKLN